MKYCIIIGVLIICIIISLAFGLLERRQKRKMQEEIEKIRNKINKNGLE